jgi:hypothetical protein
MNHREKILRRFLNENLFLSAELGGPKGGVISGIRRAQGRGEITILRESGLAESPGPDLLMQGRVRFLLHCVAWLPTRMKSQQSIPRRGGGGLTCDTR